MADQITIDRAIVEQALEALEWHLARGAYGADLEGVTGNLRAALAQQAEPVQHCEIERLRAEREALLALIADDSFAAAFQTIYWYRSALLKSVREPT